VRRRSFLAGAVALPAAARLAKAASNTVTLRYADKRQVVEGFGTCINTWQADVAHAYRQDGFVRSYLEQLGATALRIELWGGLPMAPRERWQDISWHEFAFYSKEGNRAKVTVEVAKRLSARSNGSLRIIATAWSPPPWMKLNGTLGNGHPKRKNYALKLDDPIEGGKWTKPGHDPDGQERYRYVALNKLRHDRYRHFAKLLVEWKRYFRSQGVELYAMSPANEPRFSHWFSSCVYTPEEYAELLEIIAEVFAAEGEPQTAFFGPEHMTWDLASNRRYLDAIARRKAGAKSLYAVAAHGYIDGYAADLRGASTVSFGRLVEAYGKKAWITEGGFGAHDWPAPLHQLGAALLYALRDGNVSLLTVWQTLTRDPPNEHGLMSLQGPTKKTYVAMQFWRFIRPGMYRIGVDVDAALDAVAFDDAAEARTVLVILNRASHAQLVSLKPTGRRRAKIEAVYVTDVSRNCSPIPGVDGPNVLAIPPESVLTVLLSARD